MYLNNTQGGNIYMCNRCGCNDYVFYGFSDYDFDRFDWDRGYSCYDDYGRNALNEAERIARFAMRRDCRENRCARQFVRCMRNARCGSNW